MFLPLKIGYGPGHDLVSLTLKLEFLSIPAIRSSHAKRCYHTGLKVIHHDPDKLVLSPIFSNSLLPRRAPAQDSHIKKQFSSGNINPFKLITGESHLDSEDWLANPNLLRGYK